MSRVFVRIWLTAAAMLLIVGICNSQQSGRRLTNQDVVQLVVLGLSDDVVVDKIHTAAGTDFDTTIEGLKALKAAKVSDIVLRAMINPRGVPAQQPDANVAPDPNDPMSQHSPGIYILQNGRMTLLGSSPASLKVGLGLKPAMFPGLAKTDGKISLEGPHAVFQTMDAAPVFYFYLEQQQSAFGNNGAPTSVAQFKLLRFDTKRNNREAVVMQTSVFDNSTAIPDKDAIAFSSSSIRNNAFKVTPNVTLAPGEYGFVAAGVLVTVFDFGVSPKQ